MLMTRRRADQSLPLCWEFPGGKIEPGESPAAALMREIHEELGCRVRVGAIYDVVFHAYDDFDLTMLVYCCKLAAGQPRPVQVDAVEWVEPADAAGLKLPPADHPLVARIIREARKAKKVTRTGPGPARRS